MFSSAFPTELTPDEAQATYDEGYRAAKVMRKRENNPHGSPSTVAAWHWTRADFWDLGWQDGDDRTAGHHDIRGDVVEP